MIFHDSTVDFYGTRRSQRKHDSAALYPGQGAEASKRAVVKMFRDMLECHGPKFHQALPINNFHHIELLWMQQRDTAAMATFWSHSCPLTTSALASGADPAADKEALEAAQQLIVRLQKGPQVEIGFDLLSIVERPVIISVVMLTPPTFSADLAFVASMETCLAAAFFEKVIRKPWWKFW